MPWLSACSKLYLHWASALSKEHANESRNSHQSVSLFFTSPTTSLRPKAHSQLSILKSLHPWGIHLRKVLHRALLRNLIHAHLGVGNSFPSQLYGRESWQRRKAAAKFCTWEHALGVFKGNRILPIIFFKCWSGFRKIRHSGENSVISAEMMDLQQRKHESRKKGWQQPVSRHQWVAKSKLAFCCTGYLCSVTSSLQGIRYML